MMRRISAIIFCLITAALLLNAAEVPRKSPEFAINTTNGRQVLLSSYRGKPVILTFILTYCSHCQHTTEVLGKLQREYGPRGPQVLSSAIEDMAAMALPVFLKRSEPPYPVGYNSRDQVLEYRQHPAMFKLMMPQVVCIDRQGVVRTQL